jgi:hypothetical protein
VTLALALRLRCARSGAPGIAPGPVKPIGERTAEYSEHAERRNGGNSSSFHVCVVGVVCGQFNVRGQSRQAGRS